MRKQILILAVAACIPFAASAGDKDKAGSMGPSFDTLDANRDGRISQAEAAVDATLVFSTADKDGDGYLTKKEFRSRDKSTESGAQPQSMPEQTPAETQSTPEADSTQPEAPPSTEPQADTETPRQ